MEEAPCNVWMGARLLGLMGEVAAGLGLRRRGVWGFGFRAWGRTGH